MKIAVCIKRVPDSETRVKIAADGKTIDEAGVKFVMNPYDEFALEEALRRKEKAGSGEVVVVCLGPAAAQETIRTALSWGADRGVLLQADSIPADPFQTATVIAAELKGTAWDLVLFGRMAIDDYSHQVGPLVAELLGLPCVTAVSHLDIEGTKGVAEREIEGGMEVVNFSLPAVLTTDVCGVGPLQGADQAGKYGADNIITLTNPAFARYAPEACAQALAERAKQGGYQTVLFAASATGKDLAPRVAAKLGVAVAAD